MTIQGRFNTFTKKIRPTDEHFTEANRQVDYMIQELKGRVAGDGTFTLEKVLKAGSNAKHTSLLKTENNEFDVDVAVYFDGTGAKKSELNALLSFLRQQLIDIYPTKSESDFVAQKSSVRVSFLSGIRLEVDVVPIVADSALGLENGGWIPRSDGEWRLTSVTLHNSFIRGRTAMSKQQAGNTPFNRLNRLVKWWNNLQGEFGQPTFVIDMLTAAAYDAVGVTPDWQSTLRNMFAFWLRHGVAQPIVFSDHYDPAGIALPNDTVVVLDPVNPGNNVTRSWTDATRAEFLERVQDSYDRMCMARSYDMDGDEEAALEEWCEVLGPLFRELTEE